MSLAERVARLQVRVNERSRAPVILVFPEWASPDDGLMVVWSGRTPTQAEIQAELDRHDAEQGQRPVARQREALGDTPAAVARTLEARALVTAAKERAVPAPTTWRRCACKARVEVPADGGVGRCARCGRGA
jgi:hypothetical protein